MFAPIVERAGKEDSSTLITPDEGGEDGSGQGDGGRRKWGSDTDRKAGSGEKCGHGERVVENSRSDGMTKVESGETST